MILQKKKRPLFDSKLWLLVNCAREGMFINSLYICVTMPPLRTLLIFLMLVFKNGKHILFKTAELPSGLGSDGSNLRSDKSNFRFDGSKICL